MRRLTKLTETEITNINVKLETLSFFDLKAKREAVIESIVLGVNVEYNSEVLYLINETITGSSIENQISAIQGHFAKQDVFIENAVNNLTNITHGHAIIVTDKYEKQHGFTSEDCQKVRDFIDFIESKKVVRLSLA